MGPAAGDEAHWLALLPEAVLVVGDGAVLYANRRARELFDPTAQRDLHGLAAARLLPPDAQADEGAVPQAQRLDGGRFAAALCSVPVRYGGRAVTLHLVRGVEHEQNLQQRLDNKRHELRMLSGRLIHLQERERRHIARELHDEIGQCLSAIRVQFAKLQRRVDSADALALIDSAASMTERTLGRVRSLSLLLHPPQLETLGLNAALRWHLDEQQRLHSWRIRFEDTPIDRPVHPDLAIAVYRIVQESLSNALRHGAARQVTVRLAAGDEALTLEVIDDGRGFDPEAARAAAAVHPTLGLAGMAARARLLCGEFTLSSAPGCGTHVAVRLPWKAADDHDDPHRDPGR